MKNTIVIAIDGYSACGKSTMAKDLAKKLHFIYVDTGAMYRAVTLYFLRNKVDVTSNDAVNAALNKLAISFKQEGEKVIICLNDEDVSDEIRQMQVASNVSRIAAIREVRVAMVKQQQLLAKSINVVMDGRDIGTAVFPDAQVKFFMTADPKVRAERRYKELVATDPDITMEAVFENLAQRDHEDTTRKESPLVQAPDAIVLDNTHLTPAEQIAFALSKIEPFLS